MLFHCARHALSAIVQRNFFTLTRPVRLAWVTGCDENQLFDEVLEIKMGGLPRDEDVTMYASHKVSGSTIYESFARYRTSPEGTLDLTKDSSCGGTYLGVEPMGLFWSMQPRSLDNKRPLRFPNQSMEAPVYNVFVHRGKRIDPKTLMSTVNPNQRLADELLRFRVQRPFAAPGVRRVPVRDGGLVGTLFLPAGEGPHPGVLVMFGGYPGIREYKGALLASRGFASLVLAYYGVEHLPPLFETLDLGYFEKAVNFIKQHPHIRGKNGIGVVGLCKGGSVAMAMASLLPGIRCVVVVSSAICQAFGGLQHNGTFFPETKLRPHYPGVDGIINLKEFFDLPAPDDFSNLPGYYPFETRHHVAYLIIACEDDKCVPASYCAKVAERQLSISGHPDYEVVFYPGAGHILEPPCFPLCPEAYQPEFNGVIGFGGKQPCHSVAERDAWSRQLNFLDGRLK